MTDPKRLAKIGRVLTARRKAAEARLGATLQAVRMARGEAEGFRHAARSCVPCDDPATMQATSRWQGAVAADARAADARAEDLMRDADLQRADLSGALGRERALSAILEKAVRRARRDAERRAEHDRPQLSSSGGSSSNTGTA